MQRTKIKEIKTLIIRLATIALIGIAGYLIYKWFFAPSDKDEFEIDNTPLKIEQVRSILELNTINFQDEVVVDTLEMYQDVNEHAMGNLEKLFSFEDFENAISSSPIKRRLTLIVKGELLYGVNLKTKEFDVYPKNDTLYVMLPAPELLSVSINPKNTEVFVENGKWQDFERRLLMKKAKNKMIASGEQLHLRERAKEPIIKLMHQLLKSDLPVVIQFASNE